MISEPTDDLDDALVVVHVEDRAVGAPVNALDTREADVGTGTCVGFELEPEPEPERESGAGPAPAPELPDVVGVSSGSTMLRPSVVTLVMESSLLRSVDDAS